MSDPADDDKSFERVLASFLREDLGFSRRGCPQPGMLSVYFEKKLAEAEARELELHLSHCGACQAEVAALVRLQPEPAVEAGHAEPVVAPSAVAAPSGPAPEPEKTAPPVEPALEATRLRPKPPRTLWKWLGPLGLAASAVLAISVTYRFAPFIEQASRRSAEPQARRKTEAVSAAPGKLEQRSPAAPTVAAPAAAPAPPAEARGKQETIEARKDEQELRPRPADRAAAPPAQAASPERTAASAKAAEEATGGAVVIVAQTDPSVAWRVVDASIERSDDGGTTWRTQSSGAAGLLTGSAPSPAVCWLAGRNGLVLRTADGEHWKRVAAPTTADLTEIEARSDSDATVRTGGGERFFTLDGGESWSKP